MRIVKTVADPSCPGDQVSVLMSDNTTRRISLLEWAQINAARPKVQRCDANRKRTRKPRHRN